MKKFLQIISMFILMSLFFACKKSRSSPSVPTGITGYWFGAFKTTSGLTGNEGQLFKSDGTTVEYDFYGTSSTDTASCPNKAYGSYTLKNSTVNFSVTFGSSETFNEILTVNTSVTPNTMSGTYTSPSVDAAGGSVSFTKQ